MNRFCYYLDYSSNKRNFANSVIRERSWILTLKSERELPYKLLKFIIVAVLCKIIVLLPIELLLFSGYFFIIFLK